MRSEAKQPSEIIFETWLKGCFISFVCGEKVEQYEVIGKLYLPCIGPHQKFLRDDFVDASITILGQSLTPEWGHAAPGYAHRSMATRHVGATYSEALAEALDKLYVAVVQLHNRDTARRKRWEEFTAAMRLFEVEVRTSLDLLKG